MQVSKYDVLKVVYYVLNRLKNILVLVQL